ncbi:hypothetical protein LCGC14_0725470 [marine sediment metagenome]|uniref:Transglutaminase-like domain-containing protein n=1 Tax=marine sediment metagenome TaxID=412755 RepID=A0A0F9TID6_9ZZZZ|nr:MAG: Protein-glutamine gamma-glutamyltransferase [Candidatus Lokiarchaeum sp. GC14_75]
MPTKNSSYIGSIFLFTLIFPLFSITTIGDSTRYSHPRISPTDYGVSNYKITQSVKYQVDINFSLTQKTGTANFLFKFARLDNRVPNSTFTRYTPPYQESQLLYSNLYGSKPYYVNMGHQDKFNNTFDSFSTTLSPFVSMISTKLKSWVRFNQKYIVLLNAIEFPNIKESDIGSYDTTDEIFKLYSNQTEPYYERDESSLIELSNNLVKPNDNPIEKAEKINNWISNNIDYNENMPSQEMGALWAYNNLEGDCSEYSSLMITLLRIQGIPARKVSGFLISNDLAIKPQVGDMWTFHASESDSNLIGHAWVEYFIPNIGWIACDPTWNYFNQIDFLRLSLNVGANFLFPPYNTVSEFLNPLFSYTLGAEFEYDYTVKITAIESTLIPSLISPLKSFIIILIVVILGLFIVFYIVKKVKKRNPFYLFKLNSLFDLMFNQHL